MTGQPPSTADPATQGGPLSSAKGRLLGLLLALRRARAGPRAGGLPCRLTLETVLAVTDVGGPWVPRMGTSGLSPWAAAPVTIGMPSSRRTELPSGSPCDASLSPPSTRRPLACGRRPIRSRTAPRPGDRVHDRQRPLRHPRQLRGGVPGGSSRDAGPRRVRAPSPGRDRTRQPSGLGRARRRHQRRAVCLDARRGPCLSARARPPDGPPSARRDLAEPAGHPIATRLRAVRLAGGPLDRGRPGHRDADRPCRARRSPGLPGGPRRDRWSRPSGLGRATGRRHERLACPARRRRRHGGRPGDARPGPRVGRRTRGMGRPRTPSAREPLGRPARNERDVREGRGAGHVARGRCARRGSRGASHRARRSRLRRAPLGIGRRLATDVGRLGRQDRWRPGGTAGGAILDLPPPDRRSSPRRAGEHRRQDAVRPRLSRAHVLGHRDVHAALLHAHPARDRPEPAVVSLPPTAGCPPQGRREWLRRRAVPLGERRDGRRGHADVAAGSGRSDAPAADLDGRHRDPHLGGRGPRRDDVLAGDPR